MGIVRRDNPKPRVAKVCEVPSSFFLKVDG